MLRRVVGVRGEVLQRQRHLPVSASPEAVEDPDWAAAPSEHPPPAVIGQCLRWRGSGMAAFPSAPVLRGGRLSVEGLGFSPCTVP